MKAVLISIGDELILGQIVDTNASWLSARLAEHGIITLWHQTVSDDCPAITAACREAAAAADLVLMTGGLGPTPDDLTRAALADALGVELLMHTPARVKIEHFFHSRGRQMSPCNLSQAMLPAGAQSLDNPAGTAPGILARLGRADVFVMPGVPREMRVMFDRHILPRLAVHSGRVILSACLDTFGLGESAVAELLGGLMGRERNPLIGTTVENGVVSVRIRAENADMAVARAALEATVAEVRKRLGIAVFTAKGETLAEVVGQLLCRHQRRLVTSESCTGGLISKMLTDMPGASKFYLGGWVTYANSMKIQELHVPETLLKTAGAVSEEVAREMAESALESSGADYALAVTGIAGPEGGTADKPVGTVWIAMSERTATGVVTHAQREFWPGERAMVRERSAKVALNMLRLALEV